MESVSEPNTFVCYSDLHFTYELLNEIPSDVGTTILEDAYVEQWAHAVQPFFCLAGPKAA